MTLNCIDISSWQAGLYVPKMKTTGVVIVKATEDVDYFNPHFDKWAADTVASGRKLGCYHFMRPGDAVKQADFFLSKTKKYWGKAIMFLDWEENAVPLGPEVAKAWCDRVFAKTGSKPMIYMSKSVCNAYDWSCCKNAGYELWVAQYPDYSQTGFKKQSEIWTDSSQFGAWKSTWTLFQYTSNGHVEGYDGPLDLDCYRYDKVSWDEHASGSKWKQAVSKVTTSTPKPVKAKWKAMVDEAVSICKDDSHGYSQYRRWAPDYDCSSLMFHCAERAGYGVDMHDPRYTGSMIDKFTEVGFAKVKFKKSILRAGDILLSHNCNRQHTELYIGDGKTAGAHIAETGGIDGQTGDQTGNEISIQELCWTPDWILRPPDSGDAAYIEDPPSNAYMYKVTANSQVNVRTKRSINSTKVGSIKRGKTVWLVGVKKNKKGNVWGKVACGKYAGRFIAVGFNGSTLVKKVASK